MILFTLYSKWVNKLCHIKKINQNNITPKAVKLFLISQQILKSNLISYLK
jgi:hypothetical protein